MAYSVRIITNTLPVAVYENGRWNFGSDKVSCKPYGEMDDGTMVWSDDNGHYYIKQKLFGKYFFIDT